ncbi:hypothetical protein LSG25_12515 [Paralcaligenes sp. KSB-10]|jgi:hypothetical protein|uniref:hypothetical protein n=1 Tax=Paralcaligenes sp. KSB-10 TaxID=2901142 RepID=UPI001E4ABE5B|nr:hypothetical protein [Paralcaligenes sp. KSB-10]UHL62895.1 hypothetical protein LSG25_12515 [Paralcaligenes sp. KSB-10]
MGLPKVPAPAEQDLSALLDTAMPSPEERSALLEEIGPLPLHGQAWPIWIKILAWIIVLIIGMQITYTATSPGGHNVSPLVAGSILVCFLALLVVARFMLVSETRITRIGIEQSWITRRQVAWEDIRFAKFIPLFTSKRLVCFTSRGRPVVFQAGTRELQVAFARIALVYRRRR